MPAVSLGSDFVLIVNSTLVGQVGMLAVPIIG